MISLSAIKDRGMRLVPGKSVWLEATGLLLAGLGLLMILATLSYNPADYQYMNQTRVENLAGPTGAWLAHIILGNFGVVGIACPIALAIFGLFTAFGFVRNLSAKRALGFLSLIIFSSAIAEIGLSYLAFSAPYFGFGGDVGRYVGDMALSRFGYNGSLLILTLFALISLVMTGNLSISRTSEYLRFISTRGYQFFSVISKKLFAGPASEEELIRAALAELRPRHAMAPQKSGLESKVGSAGGVSMEMPSLEGGKKGRKKSTAADMLESISPQASDEVAPSDGKIQFYYEGGNHDKPSPSLFSRSTKIKSRKSEFESMAKKLTAQLAQFKVEGHVKRIVEGPVVTTYEFEPAPGTKLSKIVALEEDLARLLQAKSLRILAPIPGKKVCGFEVPNSERKTIGFADLAENKKLRAAKIKLPIAMGVDVTGEPVIEDLTKMPHLLVAGSTGSGKSVFMNSLIASLICRHSAKDLRFIMIDPKMVELAAYNDLPHMACPVVSDPQVDAKAKLDALVAEMEDRFRKMQMLGARNIESFNEIIHSGRKTQFPKWTDKWQTMPFIVLIIDELADMMMVLGKEVEVPITRLAQKARAAGIHLVIATQRPSAEVVTGLIKSNFPTRVAFRVLSGLDSRTILDQNGAEVMIGQGDMLYLNSTGIARLHGAYLSESEVQKMVKATRGK